MPRDVTSTDNQSIIWTRFYFRVKPVGAGHGWMS